MNYQKVRDSSPHIHFYSQIYFSNIDYITVQNKMIRKLVTDDSQIGYRNIFFYKAR